MKLGLYWSIFDEVATKTRCIFVPPCMYVCDSGCSNTRYTRSPSYSQNISSMLSPTWRPIHTLTLISGRGFKSTISQLLTGYVMYYFYGSPQVICFIYNFSLHSHSTFTLLPLYSDSTLVLSTISQLRQKHGVEWKQSRSGVRAE